MIELPKAIPLPEFVGAPKPVIQMATISALKINEIIAALASMPSGPKLVPIDLVSLIPNQPTIPPIPIPPPKQPFQAPEQILKKGTELASVVKLPEIPSTTDLLKSTTLPSIESVTSLVPQLPKTPSMPQSTDISKVVSTELPSIDTKELTNFKKFVS